MTMAQNYLNVAKTDEKEFYTLQEKFPKLIKDIEANNGCIGESESDKLVLSFYKRVDEFLATSSPGFNMDSLQTRQFVYLLDRLHYLLSKSIIMQSPILSHEFHQKIGLVWYDYLFLIDNMNDVIARVEQDD